MKWVLLTWLGLCGCQASFESRHFDYCAVTDVEKQPDVLGGYWIAHCSDGRFIVFSRMIQEGTGLYFTPYYENNDAVTTHGYVQRTEILP